MPVVSVHDVAKYILQQRGPMSGMKLQKLLYYSQAWSLVFDDMPLFAENIEAWRNGPVVREVYELHRGQFTISEWPKGNPDALDAEQKRTVDSVLGYYGDKDAQWLSDLTHSEDPWLNARKGLGASEKSARVIPLTEMAEYYANLRPADE